MGHIRKKQITVFLTTKCNMNCKYCLTSVNESKPISIDVNFAKNGIKDFFDNYKSYWVRFYGPGEPTLEFERMCKIKKYAEEIAGGQIKVELQTNGVFDADIADWISDNVDIVYISIDGPPNVNDLYRKDKLGNGKSNLIIENIKKLVDNCTVCIRSTITDVNIYRQKEMIDFFLDLGVNAIFSKPVLNPVKYSKKKYSYEVNLLTYAHYFTEAHFYAKRLGAFYGNIYISNFDEAVTYACRACIPCPHLTPDGYVSACDRAFEGETLLKDFIYGKYIKKEDRIIYFDEKVLKLMNRRLENIDPCNKCEIGENCAATCLGTAYQYTGSISGIIKEQCEIIKYWDQYRFGAQKIDQKYPVTLW